MLVSAMDSGLIYNFRKEGIIEQVFARLHDGSMLDFDLTDSIRLSSHYSNYKFLQTPNTKTARRDLYSHSINFSKIKKAEVELFDWLDADTLISSQITAPEYAT